MNEAFGAPPWAARTQVSFSRMLWPATKAATASASTR